MSYIFVINTFFFSLFHFFFPYGFYQLLGGFIHTNNGKVLIIRSLVDIKNLFHVCHKFGILLGRNYPTFYFPRLKFVFFKVLYIDTCEIVSTYSNSTTLSANIRNVHLAKPLGGSLQHNCTILASKSPSTFFS